MIERVESDCSMRSRARSIAFTSAEKMEDLFGRRHFFTLVPYTAAAATELPSLDPSV